MEVGQFVSLQFEKLSGIVIAISAVRVHFLSTRLGSKESVQEKTKDGFFQRMVNKSDKLSCDLPKRKP